MKIANIAGLVKQKFFIHETFVGFAAWISFIYSIHLS